MELKLQELILGIQEDFAFELLSLELQPEKSRILIEKKETIIG